MSEVPFRQLGSSGLNVSVVGVGCNNFGFRIDEDATNAVVAAALDAGLNLFDTAASYGASEERLGKALGARRAEVVIATKWPSPFETTKHQPGSRHHIIEACEGSLRRLGTDYIDLYQMHRPDPLTPIDETLARARRPRAVRQGALRRQLELRRMADRRRRLDLAHEWLGSHGVGAEPVLPGRPARRERRHPRVPPLRRRDAAVLSACERAAHRQVQARSRRARRRAAQPRQPDGGACGDVPERPQLRQGRGAREGRCRSRSDAAASRDREASPRSQLSRRSSLAPHRPSRSRPTSRRGRGCLLPTCSPRSTKPRSERVAHARRAPRRGRGFGRPARRVRSPGGARRSCADVPRRGRSTQLVAHQAMVHRWATAHVRGDEPDAVLTQTQVLETVARPRSLLRRGSRAISSLLFAMRRPISRR